MSMFARLRNQTLQWWYDVPLPACETDATPIFQSWYRFDSSVNKWASFECTSEVTGARYNPRNGGKFVLVTWNVDAASPAPEARISALISHIQSLATPVDIIFLQEVSRAALLRLLETPWLREHWFLSEGDTTNWGKQSFASMTLVSRSQLTDPQNAALGPIWRVKYPSRFERDALCCDIFLSSHGPGGKPLRVRLTNVHLDSLPINPSLRPRQLSIVTSYLHATGHGLVAGDFNPVLPDDDMLVSANNLLDVWNELYPSKAGFTWGADGNQQFPPNRLDKVAVLGLKPCSLKIIAPGNIGQTSTSELRQKEEEQKQDHNQLLKWSDHSGLMCSFAL